MRVRAGAVSALMVLALAAGACSSGGSSGGGAGGDLGGKSDVSALQHALQSETHGAVTAKQAKCIAKKLQKLGQGDIDKLTKSLSHPRYDLPTSLKKTGSKAVKDCGVS